MQAQFGLERERSGEMLLKELENDSGPFHFHSQVELYFVDEGTVEAVVNDRKRLLTAGQAAVSLRFDAHSYRTVGTSRSCLLVIPPRLSEEFMDKLGSRRPSEPFLTDPAATQQLRACAAAIGRHPGNSTLCQGLLYVILGLLPEQLDLRETAAPTDGDLSSRMLLYLSSHFDQEVSLEVLASEFGYSPSHLSRHFKACFGMGVGQYVNLLRLRKAMPLLRTGKYSHTWCALESGFPSVRTFYRAFKNEFGCSPREYLAGRGNAW